MISTGKVPLTSAEKEFMYYWVEEHLSTSTTTISWKLLQAKIEEKFGILRSQGDLKNNWNARKRRIERQIDFENIYGNSVYNYDSDDIFVFQPY